MKVATIGQRIEEIRKDKGLSQKALAESAGITRSLLSMLEIDKRLPPIDILQRIAERLDVSFYFLMTGIEDNNHAIYEDLKLSNNAINTIKTLSPSNLEAIEILLRNRQLLTHFYHYFCGDFARLTFNMSPLDSDQVEFQSVDLTNYNGLSPDDLERLERLRLMDDIASARKKERGCSNETGKW